MKGLDVILGMDWLNTHKVKIDCAARIVQIPNRNLEVYCTHHPNSDLQNLYVFDDGPRFIILCIPDIKSPMNVNFVPIVYDFPEVFPRDIESLPTEREVEFTIKLIPGAGPVSKASYGMALLELAELKQ
jgi:hypothetical protein